MSGMHSSGSAKRVVRPQGMPSDARLALREKGIAHQQARRPDVAGTNLHSGAMIAATSADCEKIDLWSWMIASFMEGFAAYGASFHGIAAFPVDPHPAEAAATHPEGSPFRTRRRHISLVSPCARSELTAPEFNGGTNPVASGPEGPFTTDGPAGRHGLAALDLGQPIRWQWLTSCRGVVGTLWTHRRRERKIKKSVAALTGLDDHTLRAMGIPHRSQIEQAVRYCHDC
jgi:hypothetical protein